MLLRCHDLSVSFGSRRVFESLSFSLPAGAYALRGPNGIGKSTLLRLLSGAQTTDNGEVWIDGTSLTQSPLAAKRSLSYVPDDSGVYPFMTGRDLLDFVASAKKVTIEKLIEGMIAAFDLHRQLHVRFDAMSLGTQKKMMICAAFIGAPRVVLMDEPSNGLDVDSRVHLEDMIRSWSNENLILISTHDDEFSRAINARSISMQGLVPT